jgi:hypothetical protein
MAKRIEPTARDINRLKPSGALIDAVEAFLVERTPSRKRPTVAAGVLAMVLELDDRGEAFPLREWAALALNCSIFSIDAALSVAMARGYLRLEVRTVEGEVAARDSVAKERWFIPAQQLKAVLEQVSRRRGSRVVA